jgi:phospholipid/cholesterol/gamma-HCH transport system permease protein
MSSPSLPGSALLESRVVDGRQVFAAIGRWDIASLAKLDAALRDLSSASRPLRIDVSALDALDTASALLVHRLRIRLAAEGSPLELIGLKPDHAALIEQVAAMDRPPLAPAPVRPFYVRILEGTGEAVLIKLSDARSFVAFLGLTVATLGVTLMTPRRLRFTSLVYNLEQTGLNALPIVGLISFLIGIVLAYQGASQLRRFGADIFVVNLIGVSILREIGILLTAIVVAGRSGSAFTAQIGAMMVREEVAAMRTLGLDPIEVLVLPRLLALVIAMPLLAFFADLAGLVGGGLMSWIELGIAPAVFIERLNTAIYLWTFGVGLVKAPVFALLIALVGCHEGFRVTSAENIGRLTTRSVVQSIFLVIVADAAFSVLFNLIGI